MSFSEAAWEEKRSHYLELAIVKEAIERLENELPAKYEYHSIAHTRDVLGEALRFAMIDELAERELELLAVGAAYHDLGFVVKPVDNEWTGARFAREAMERHGGYTESEIQCVEDMILDTQLVETALGATQLPTDKLAMYLLDADLGNLGREDFFDCAERLQKELGVERELFFREAKRLLTGHRWLTPAANAIRHAGREQNLERVEQLLSDRDGSSTASGDVAQGGLDLNRLLFLAKLPHLLNTSLSVNQVCETAMGHLRSMSGAEAATIFLLDGSGQELRFWALTGGDAERLKDQRMPADRGIVGWAIQNGESLCLNDVKADPRFYSSIEEKSEFETRSVICVPLTVRGSKRLGAIQVLNKRDHQAFTPDDLLFVDQFAQQLAFAIDNAQLFEQSEEMRQMLTKLDQRKSEMITVLTHEFRTPLNVIQTSADLLATEGVASQDMQEKLSQTLLNGVTRLSRLVGQLQSLSQVQGSEVTVNVEPTNIRDLCQEVFATYRPHAMKRNLELSLEADGDVVVTGDRSLLYVVLANLVSNAIRFTADGGSISLSLSVENDLVTVAVADTGIGIPEAEQSLIFEKFYEVGDAMQHASGDFQFRSGGLGLGLPTAQEILRQHSSTLELESQSGKGSRFYFSLPVNEAG